MSTEIVGLSKLTINSERRNLRVGAHGKKKVDTHKISNLARRDRNHVYCFDEPETVHAVLKKAITFLISYGQAMKDAGADGIMMAEHLAGLLNPDMDEEQNRRAFEQSEKRSWISCSG